MSVHGSSDPRRTQFRARPCVRSRVVVPAAWLAGGAAAAALASDAQLASAQQPPAEDAAADRAQAFRAVEGAVEEDVPGGPLLVGAYTVVLTLLVLYVIRVTRLQQRVGADLARLEGALRKGGAGDASDG